VTEVNQEIEMVTFEDGLQITNYHPIFIENKWQFPVDVKESTKVFVDKYYNFVLENGHTMRVNGVDCITLGHGIKGDKVLEHEYLGTSAVLEDLGRLEGWSRGLVSISIGMVKRDPVSNLIVGIANN